MAQTHQRLIQYCHILKFALVVNIKKIILELRVREEKPMFQQGKCRNKCKFGK